MHWEIKKKIHVTCFTEIFTVLSGLDSTCNISEVCPYCENFY